MDSIQIEADSSFFVNLITTNNTCVGESNGSIIAEIIGGVAPFTFVWNDSTLMGDALQNLVDGIYTLRVTDSTDASVIVSATISSSAQISLNETDSKIVDESCPEAGDGQISLVASGGTAPYSYIIEPDTTDNGVYLDLNAGTYAVLITDSNGCTTTNDLTVGNTFAGTLSADFTAIVDSQSVTLSPTTIDTSATYNWTFGDGTTSSEINPSVTFSEDGAYEICLSITNECGASTTCQTITIGVTGPIKFVVNSLNGTASDTVIIPITVENFVNIVSVCQRQI